MSAMAQVEQPRPVEKRTCVVIVEIPIAGETRVVGIVVDAVLSVSGDLAISGVAA